MLFLLFMRDPKVKDITDVPSLVKFFCQSDTLTNKITDWLIRTRGQYLAVVIDGYDEMSAENKNHCIIDSIINRQILPKCVGIISSRPGPSLHLHDRVTCRAEILGFSAKNRLDFIQNAFNRKIDTIKGLKGFLQSNPSLNGLCYIPLNMSILLSLTVDGIDALPGTQTGLYEKFILMTIIHFMKKDKLFNTTITSLDNLPHLYNQAFKELSQFAFLALRKNQIVFTLAEVKAECPNLTPGSWYGLGLLKPAQYFKAQDGCDHESFHFIHYSIQEYMAAYYIASLSGNRLSSLLWETFWNPQYFNTWVMYVGITGGKNFEFTHFLSGNRFQVLSWYFKAKTISSLILRDKIKCLQLLRCSAETDHEMLLSIKEIFQEEIIEFSNQSLSVNDIRMLGDLLMKLPRRKWKMLDLSNCNVNDESCDLFCELFLSNNITLKINTVDISDNSFNWESLDQFCKIFRLWKVNTLIMSIEALYDKATINTIKRFESKLHKRISTIGKPFLWPSSYSKLLLTYLPEQNKMIAAFVCGCTYRCMIYTNYQLDDDNLVERIVSFIKFQHQNHKILSSVIINYYIPTHVLDEKFSTISHHFHRVVFKGLHMHSKGIFKLKQFSEAMICTDEQLENLLADFIMAVIVHSNSKPEKSYLKTIPVPCAKNIKERLRGYSSILYICACDSIFDNKVASDIATILSCNPYLKVLCFGGNNLHSTGAIRVAQGLYNTSTLTSIILCDNDIGGKEATSCIASVLSNNCNLEVVNLNRNNFQTRGAIEIAKALRSIYTLTEFKIAENNINEEAADDIAAVLSHNTKLQKLDLSNNNLQTMGIIKIVRALQNTSTLETFEIACNNISEDAADDIATALSYNTGLCKLYLSNNNLNSAGIIMIAKVLQSHLTNIDMSNNNMGIGESVATNIAIALSQCHQLVELKLNRNNLQAMSVIKIAKSLQKLSCLEVIDFSSNNISEEAAVDIAAVVSHNKFLTNVDLSVNNFKANGIIKISRALGKISNLQELNISSNNVSEEAAADIAAVISINNEIKNIDLHHNQLQTAGIIIIAKALETNSTLEVFNISDNNISENAAEGIAAALTNKKS